MLKEFRHPEKWTAPRRAQMDAAVQGAPARRPTDPAAVLQRAFATAMVYDADLFARPGFAGAELLGMLA